MESSKLLCPPEICQEGRMPSRPLTRVARRKAANFIFSSKNKNISSKPWKVDAYKGKDGCCNDGMRQDKPVDVLLHLVFAQIIC